MRLINVAKTIKVPEGVTVTLNGRNVAVSGPRGEMKRSFPHQMLEFSLLNEGKTLKIEKWFGTKKELACVRTILSHVNNMIVGVTQGYRYKMRFVYSHFPINLSIVGTPEDAAAGTSPQVVEIRNFLGEKRVRRLTMHGCTQVRRSEKVKDQIELEGNNIDDVSQSAADIQQSTRVRNKDIRKFLDGIYVNEKGAIPAPLE